MRNTTAWLDAAVTVHRVSDGRDRASVALLVDAGIADNGIVTQTREWLRQNGCEVRITAVQPDSGLTAVRVVMPAVAGARLVVAVGGGSVLDAVKLGTVAVDNERFRGCLTVPQRGGLVLVPPGTGRTVPLIAIPKTVGTGSETSQVAVVSNGTSRRLVIGAALRPEARVLDPLATAGLPGYLLIEGLAEILARVVSPYIGDHRTLPSEDALAETVAARLVQLGDLLAADPAHTMHTMHNKDSAALRLDLARLSSLSHTEWLARDGNPYAVKGWLLANELAAVTGVRKMTATVALWPTLWAHIDRGDTRLGSAARLRGMWAHLRGAHRGELPDEPAAGIRLLLGSWGLISPVTASPAQVHAAVHAVNRSWGAGLPMLGGLGLADIRELISAAVASGPVVSGPAINDRAADVQPVLPSMPVH